MAAQRRAQLLMDVLPPVTSVSSEVIDKAGAVRMPDLMKLASGVLINKNGANLQSTIRGIGTNSTGPDADPYVAINIDGIYRSNQTGNAFEPASVESVGILEEPQGTLFGRNATGGAILVKLSDPSFIPSGRVNLGFGRFNEVKASRYLSTGPSDTVAARARAVASSNQLTAQGGQAKGGVLS